VANYNFADFSAQDRIGITERLDLGFSTHLGRLIN
jgi:hypothetical protein